MMAMNFMFLAMLSTTAAALASSATLLAKHSANILEWKMVNMECNSMSMNLIMDWKSMFFTFTVGLISSTIIVYSKYYMPEKDQTKFIKIILTFVTSMVVLILSPSTITMLMGWEGLGMSSFILIMHFMNKKSLMSGLYTIIMNRLGDIMLMISVMMMMDFNSWMFTSLIMYKSKGLLMALTASLFSKSAQIPFSSWLTEAMAAPTPVSALVHSSTLVTAGVYVMIRMEMTIKMSEISKMTMGVAMMTLMMASMNAITEWDIKKIVALSTLTQLSTMFVAIAINMFKMAMFHMLMHAMFKALIFICSSSMISMANTQDLRKISANVQPSIITTISFNTASMSLCGLMFLSGFYSKELIIEMMENEKKAQAYLLVFSMCMAITMIYSMKMMMFTTLIKNKVMIKMAQESRQQIMAKMMLITPAICLGNKMNWMINTNSKIPYVMAAEKITPMLAMMVISLTIKEMLLKSSVTTNSKMKMMNNYMWYMKNLSIFIKLQVMKYMMTMSKVSETGNLSKLTSNIKFNMKTMSATNLLEIQSSFKNVMIATTLVLILAA